ncbi:MAG: HipA domain-containing protein [Salinisphaera sp.]|jgi:serine/threonine-protein kinase HipA|nr:HipA domain-containing protein [Salinisphaera sp.]
MNKPEQAVPVWVNDQRLGMFERVDRDRYAFVYDADYQADDWNHPLSLSMPRVRRRHVDTRASPIVRNFLCGLLPDNPAIIRSYARYFEVSRGDPLSMLAAIGSDCPGALIFGEPASGAGFKPIAVADMPTLIADLRTQASGAVLGAEYGHFSLAGAQAKTALLWRHGQWARPYGKQPSTHILKPAMQDLADQPLNEHYCLNLAREVDLPSANSWVETHGDESVVVVERYDRIDDELGTLRIHQEDVCQALGVHPDQKYEADGGPTNARIMQLLTQYSSSPEEDVKTYFRAMIFNHLICGSDAHAKNYSLLHAAGGLLRLAPLYDLNSGYPYLSRRVQRKTAMRIGGHDVLYDIHPRHFEAEAIQSGLDPRQALHWLEEMVSTLFGTANDCRQRIHVVSQTLDTIVIEIERQCERQLQRLGAL